MTATRYILTAGFVSAFAVCAAQAQQPSATAPRLSSPAAPAAAAQPPMINPPPPTPARSGGLEDLSLPQAPAQMPPVGSASLQPGASTRSADDESFENAVKQLVPLTPDQIHEFRKRQDEARRAQSLPLAPLHPVTRTVSLMLKPGEATPVIHVAAQRVTTLTFVDVTGKPWPVMSTATGDPLMLQVLSAGPANETNIITLAPLKSQGTTNVAINLTKFPVPIVMTVTTGESDVDYRVDVRLGSRGPNAVVDMIGTSSLSPTDDVTMISFIDGQPPRGAERVGTSSHDVEAWLYEKMMYVRTTTELMSPAYIAKSSGNAGVSVYKLGETPVLIVSRDGRMATVAMKR